jgi:hypothetical protein
MLWLRCIKKKKTPSKAEGVKKKNESHLKCGSAYRDFRENDY